jgi:hypothetical protein
MKITTLKPVFVAVLTILILMIAQASVAKELANRLGVGYVKNSTLALPSMAAIYYPTPGIGVFGSLGIDSQSSTSSFAAVGGFRKIIFREDNMNFFMGGNLGLLSQTVSSASNSGYDLEALVGGEFFLPGLENLGFNFDTGIAVTSINTTRFRTVGDSFVDGGVIFYF